MKTLLLFTIVLLFAGCTIFQSNTQSEQHIKICLKYGHGDEINTFEGRLVKDLVPRKVTTTFWFTEHEQEIILAKVDSINYFSLPDEIPFPTSDYFPPFTEYFKLRIQVNGNDKTIEWYDATEDKNIVIHKKLSDLFELIRTITFAKKEYKDLPPTEGGYL